MGTPPAYTADTMKQDEFIALVTRLERASDLLRNGGSLLQAIARRYYLVFTYATQAAERHGVAFRLGADVNEGRRLTHRALPDVVRALYSGQNFGSVVGGGPRRDPDWAIDRFSSGRVR